MIKKATIRFDLNQPEQREAYEILAGRNCYRYSTYADYIAPAVIAFAHQEESAKKLGLTEQDRKEIVNEILQTLQKQDKASQEPGI